MIVTTRLSIEVSEIGDEFFHLIPIRRVFRIIETGREIRHAFKLHPTFRAHPISGTLGAKLP